MESLIRYLHKTFGYQVTNQITNSAWIISEKLFRLAIGIIMLSLVARYLGVNDFGILNYSLSIFYLVSVISKLGLDDIVVREIVNNPDDENKCISTVFYLKLFGGFLSNIILVLITLVFIDEIRIQSILYLFCLINIFEAFKVIDFYFQSKVRSKYVVFGSLISFILISALKLFFIVANKPLIYFAGIYVIESLLIIIFLIYYYTKAGKTIKFNYFDSKLAKKLISISWPLIFSAFVIAIYMKTDQIMIKSILGNKEVGIYSAAVRLSETLYFIPIAICSSVFPTIISYRNKSISKYEELLHRLFVLLIWSSIVISIITSLFSKYIISIIYGNEFLESTLILNIHVWSSVFVFIGVASNKYFVAEGVAKYSLVSALLGSIINIILNLILINSIGIIGAAVSTLISQIFVNSIFDLLVKDLRKLFLIKMKALTFFIRRI